jgi:arginyl-tRNA synthetase
MIKSVVEDKVQKAAKSLGIEEKINIEYPLNPRFGNYSSNIAMHAAKQLKKAPLEVAEMIANAVVPDETIEKVEVVKPGFINIWVTQSALIKQVADNVQITTKNTSEKKKVIVEYSSPNIAKPFTIGHLRSTVIGDAVANLLQATGSTVFRDNHLGDWGTQFGKQIYAIKTWGDEEEIENSDRPVKLLVDLYVKFHTEAEKNPALEDEGRKWFKKLEDGDEEARTLWKKCVQWSMKEFKKIYKMLNVSFTENPENGYMGYGESFFEDKMGPVIKELKEKNLIKESKGAQLVFFKDDKYPPLMILKEDGATLYSTRDLATDKFRLEHYGKEIKVINEVGAEQSLYFRQLYEIEQMLGWYKSGQRIHIGHGMYRFKDKKMSTRKGNVIWLEEVLEEAVKRAAQLAKTEVDKHVSQKIGIGAIKWNDLKRSANQDVVFDWDDILNMQGNSGPYMQYTYVRATSVLKDQAVSSEYSLNYSVDQEEKELLHSLSLFNEVIEQAADRFSPHILTTYLFELAQKFNMFYQNHPILKTDPEIKSLRLFITNATAETIKKGLQILGIETVDKM